MTSEQIRVFNQALEKDNPYIDDVLGYPDSLTGKHVISLIEQASAQPKSPRYTAEGKELSQAQWQDLKGALNLSLVPENVGVKFGLITRRANLRTFPTDMPVFKDDLDADLDRFQETALFPGDPVAVFHASADKKWFFVRAFHYAGWVKQSHIGTGTRTQVKDFVNKPSRLVVTGAQVLTNYVPEKSAISQIPLDMGVSLPLLTPQSALYAGQNVSYSHMVALPVRRSAGKLDVVPALIARASDVNIGYLPYTHETLVRQSFKFLGERYGWGGRYNARDCTGFVSAIFRTFGIRMPRNSGQQGESDYGENWSVDASADTIKAQLTSRLQPGDLLYIPGHVMMVLGIDSEQPWVIHDVKGLAFNNVAGEFTRSALNGVSVTPLFPLRLSRTSRYIDALYRVKRIRSAHENH